MKIPVKFLIMNVVTYDGRPVQIANYYDKNYNKVAQKLRFPR